MRKLIRKSIKYAYHNITPLRKVADSIAKRLHRGGEVLLYDKDNQPIEQVFEQYKQDGTIAIHLHLFYTDLAKEFKKYIQHIPFSYDLYISIPEDASIYGVLSRFRSLKNAKHIIVEHSKNAGRDYGPMFVLFGDRLKKYDYLLHIHSKKSLRTGNTQDEWRHFMLNSVLGDEQTVRRNMYLLSKKDVGLVVPNAYEKQFPYWAATWLGVSNLARNLCNKLGVEFNDEYLEFAVGSFQWIRVDAIKQLFNLGLTWDDFGPERGQHDGGLEYVMERIFPLLAKNNNYTTVSCVKNGLSQKYFYGYVSMGLEQYYQEDDNLLLEKVSHYDVVSFDIFDTLLTRKVYDPDDVFRIIENEYSNRDSMKDYFERRKKSEKVWRENNPEKDCSIHDIYSEYSRLYNITKKEAEYIKNIEIQKELELIIPRRNMIDVFNSIIERKKYRPGGQKIILTSDMYLTDDIITNMLMSNGFSGWDMIYLSNSIHKRKDQYTMWGYLQEKYPGKSIIHIGDNEETDVHAPLEYGITTTHIMSGRKMFQISGYGGALNSGVGRINLGDRVALGLIVNSKLFNKTRFYDNNRYILNTNNLHDYAYTALGPIFISYFQWLIDYIGRDKDNKDILFLSREGYFLQKMYHLIKKYENTQNHIHDTYFLTSRRGISVPTIKKQSDIDEIISEAKEFKGTIQQFISEYMGVDTNERFNVDLSLDTSIVKTVVNNQKSEIFSNAKKEKVAYGSYINKLLKSKNLVIIDVGYNATTQKYLSKFLGSSYQITGCYFAAKKYNRVTDMPGNSVRSFSGFVSADDGTISTNNIYRYALILEAFLTAPNGQFISFLDNRAQYRRYSVEDKQHYNQTSAIMYNGVRDFITDYYSIVGKYGGRLTKEFWLGSFGEISKNTSAYHKYVFDQLSIEDFRVSNEQKLNIGKYV